VQLQRIDSLQARLLDHGIDPMVVDQLGDLLRRGTPQEIGNIRPIAAARRLGADEDELTSACLHAAHDGDLEMLWDILCPACQIPSNIVDSLRALRDHSHCDACDLDFELDLAGSVEMVFRVHPSLRQPDVGTYCIGGPAHSPHVLAQVLLPPGERFVLDLALEEGAYRVAGRDLPACWDFRVLEDAMLDRWDLPLREGLAADVPRSLRTGTQRILLSNDLESEALVRIERQASREDALTAARAACLPQFRRLFPGELLSPGQLVGVSRTSFLLAELADAAALYATEENTAFEALIRLQHLMQEHAGLEGGTVVKLQGEGVMAVFTDPTAAVRAALGVLRHGTLEPVRMAVHTGPSLMTTLNDRLDYFGRTVREVTDLLGSSEPAEVLLSESVLSDPGILELSRGDAVEALVWSAGDDRVAQRLAPVERADAL